MKQNTRIGLTLVGAYLFFLIITAPAALTFDKLRARIAPLTLSDVSGTLWSGHAGALNYAALRLTNLEWSVHPFGLLLGRLESGLKLDDSALRGTGTLGRTLGGTLYLTDLNGAAELQALQSSGLLKILLPVNGQALFALRKLRYTDGKLTAAEGAIEIKNAATLVPQLALGDFHLVLETLQAGIKATLSDRGGALRAQGVAMINPDGSYQFTGTFSPRDPNQASLQQYLRMLGPMGTDGRVSVNTSGRI
jgi:general secretion pathway protein N